MKNTDFDKISISLSLGCVEALQNEHVQKVSPKVVIKDENIEEYEDTKCCSYCAEPELLFEPMMVQRKPKTFIMRWNPEISSHKIRDFEESMECFLDRDFYFDWSIWDYDKVSIGDRFYMITVGNANNGIVMHGTIISLPYNDVDWSGKGRDVRYVRMNPECMIHPNKSPLILSSTELTQAIPSFNWNEGHSGELLNEQQAILLDALWESHFYRFSRKS